MIHNSVLVAAFRQLAVDATLKLDPDDFDLSAMSVQNYGMKKVMRLIRKGQDANDVPQTKQWLFEHGFLVGFVLGLRLGRIEPDAYQQAAAISWAAFDVGFR